MYHMKIYPLLLGLLLQSLPVGVNAQAVIDPSGFSYRLEIKSLNEGLAQHDVTSVTQDRYGFIWIATYNGLHRYDGYNCRVFRHDPQDPASIGDNRILLVFLDSSLRLWAATEGGGLSLYDHYMENFTNFGIGSSPSDNNIYSICENGDGSFWLGTANGLYLASYDGKRKLSAKRMDRNGFTPANIRKVSQNGYGDLFIGTMHGTWVLPRLEEGGWSEYRFMDHAGQHQVNFIEPGERDVMWIGTAGGLFLWGNNGNGMSEIRWHGKSFRNVRSVLRLDSGRFILATENDGLFELRRDGTGFAVTPMIFDDDQFIYNAIVRNLFLDDMQNLWIGTGNSGVGVVNLHAKRFYRAFYSRNDGGSFVRTFLRDHNDRLWLYTRQRGLEVFSLGGSVSSLRRLAGPPVRSEVTGLAEDRAHNVWLCTDKELYRVAAGRPASEAVDMLSLPGFPAEIRDDGSMRSLDEDVFGNIWVGCCNGILHISSPGSRQPKFIFLPEFRLSNVDAGYVNVYCQKDKCRIWICSRDFGLFMLDADAHGNVLADNRFHAAGPEGQQLTSNHVWSVVKGRDGTVWVGTDSGLNSIRFDNDGKPSVQSYRGVERLDNDKILGILEDLSGEIWLNTSIGLVRFNPSDSSVKTYYSSDGLSSNGLTERIFMDTDGTIWLGTINGITYFRPEEITDNPYTPKTAINRLSIFNREVAVGQKVGANVILDRSIFETREITLRHNQNNFTFEFVGLHFNDPARNLYAHKLEGYDRDWVLSNGGNRTASYNNLPAGKYRFMVKAANSDGVWSREASSIAVIVKASPWAAWWAYLVYAAMASMAAYLILRYSFRQRELKNKLYLEQLEHLHDKQLNDERVRFHNNITHELRTPLTLILSPLNDLREHSIDDPYVASRLKLIDKSTNRLQGLVNQFLDLRKLDRDTMPLKVSRTDVAALVASMIESFRHYARGRNINLTLVCESPVIEGWIDSEKLFKIVSNIVSNAIKYTSAEGNIAVIALAEDDILTVSVEDTGCGISEQDLPRIFDRFFQCGQGDGSGTGIGLSLVQKLVELHHGKITVSSIVGQGATFTVKLPISSSAYSPDEMAAPSGDSEKGDIPAISEKLPAAVSEKPIVLVVDDDADMRGYLGECLLPRYDVILEEDALSGQRSALRYIPDLVITDVMMPGITGLELSSMLKSDFRTSHIPIIILTARFDESDVTAGYRSGAESYITKPFNKEQLLLQVNNIIRYRRRMPSENEETAGSDVHPLSEREQKFLDKLTDIVSANIDRVDYNVEDICRQIGTSRMQLHRKLTAIIGKTASEFIRDIRMSKARELLLSGNFNVSETIYQIGFKSNSHFTKTFRETYGVTPSEFLKRHTHARE
ncbi:hybrid sensor histidine kinase/response regulator [Bacteroidia bacterium]|nr:hybrid sensor histidine kinase/response regulator [Bacteroidia bacterium]